MNKDEQLTFWKGEIGRGLRFRKQYGLDNTWKEYRDYYRHNFDNEEVNENLVFASIASESPSVLYQFPHITLTPLRPGYEAFAYVLESIDNRLAVQQDLNGECRDILVDVGTCGIGAVVLGYDSQYGFSRKDFASRELGESYTQRSKTGDRIEYETNIRRGMPWCLRVLPDDFLVPWGSSRFSQVPWFAFRFVRPIRDVRVDPKYTASARNKVQPSMDPNSEFTPDIHEGRFEKGGYPGELQPVFMWQIHDLRSGEVMVISDGCDEFLRKEPDTLQTSLGLPAEVLMFQRDPVYFWGIPEVRYYEGHMAEINETISQRTAARRNAIPLFITFKDAIDKIEKQKMTSGVPCLWIELDKVPSNDIRTLVQTLQPHIPPEFTNTINDIRESQRMVTGKSKPYMGEQLGKTHITATETRTAMNQASGRDMEKREKLARFIEKIMGKQNEIMFRHWNSKRVEHVVGPDLVSYWVEFQGSELQGEYLVQVGVDDMAPVNRETKLQEARALLELMVKDQMFTQMFPDAALQVRKTILTLFPWLNFRSFEPAGGVGRNPQQPMQMNEFANAFPQMQQTSLGANTPNMNQGPV